MKTAKGGLMLLTLILGLAACGQQPQPSPGTVPTIDPVSSEPAVTCTIVDEGRQVKWNGTERTTTVSVCSDQCLHFAKAGSGWSTDTTINCTANTWPSATWNGDAYQTPTKGCYSWFCSE